MLKEYIANHKEEITTIPMEEISLVSRIHHRGTMTVTDKPSEDLIAVVRPRKEGGYALVVGWNAYMNAKHRGLENIRCIITKDTRGGVYPKEYNIISNRKNSHQTMLC